MGKTGLVLSGGGAKGAYQVGVMQALVELDVPIDMLSGASIGALNAGVLASAPDLKVGTERLEKVWAHLAENNPLMMRGADEVASGTIRMLLPYLSLLSSAGLRANPWLVGVSGLSIMLKKFGFVDNVPLPEFIRELMKDTGFKSVLSDEVLHRMMDEYLDIGQLQKSMPLYVAVFKQDGLAKGVTDIALAQFFGIENKESLFKHLQSLPVSQQKDMLLASAAIPVLFESKHDADGSVLSDGGQGGWIKAQGNTPIAPLVEAGCNHVIVTHLNNGSLWHRHDFPNTTCVEIRPNPKLDLDFKAMFDFSAETIATLQQAGYDDTMQHIGQIKGMLDGLNAKRQANQRLDAVMQGREKSQQDLDDVMKRLQ